MYMAPKHPLNLCPACGGELEKDFDKQVYICKDCGEEWPWTMLNVTQENFEDLESMR